jgi:hypothetical protein
VSAIVLQGVKGRAGPRDAILLRDGEQPTDQARRSRYEMALIELASRYVICPHRKLRRRLGMGYQEALREGVRPNFRFQAIPPIPLTPAPDPARERRLNPPLQRAPRFGALRVAALAFGVLVAEALSRWLGGRPA